MAKNQSKTIDPALFGTNRQTKSLNENIKPHKIKEVLNDFLDAIQKDCRENKRTTDPKDPINKKIKPITNQLAPIILWGPPGIGKSSIVAEVCKDRNIGFVDVRLAQKDPVDMRGIPFPDEKDKSVDWYLSSEWPRGQKENPVISMIDPKGRMQHIRLERDDQYPNINAKIKALESSGWERGEIPSQRTFNVLQSTNATDTVKQQMTIEVVEAFRPTYDYLQYDENEDWKSPENRIKYGIIFFDEITAASQALQVAAYEMILDRKLGNDYKVPPGWYVCAAGNRAEDKSVSKPMSAALANRFLHMVVVKDIPSWMDWATINQINPLITTYICYNTKYLHYMFNDVLDDYDDSDANILLQKGWASPRAWSKVSACLDTFLPSVIEEQRKGGSGSASRLYLDILIKTIRGLVGPLAQSDFLADKTAGVDSFYTLSHDKSFVGPSQYNDFQYAAKELLSSSKSQSKGSSKSATTSLVSTWEALTALDLPNQLKQNTQLEKLANMNIPNQVRDLLAKLQNVIVGKKSVNDKNVKNNYLCFYEYVDLSKTTSGTNGELAPLFYLYKMALMNCLVHNIFQQAKNELDIEEGLNCLIAIANIEYDLFVKEKSKMAVKEYYQSFICIYEVIEKAVFQVSTEIGNMIKEYKKNPNSSYNQAEYKRIKDIMSGGASSRIRRNPKETKKDEDFDTFQKLRHNNLVAENHPMFYIKSDEDLTSKYDDSRNNTKSRVQTQKQRNTKSKLDEYAWNQGSKLEDEDGSALSDYAWYRESRQEQSQPTQSKRTLVEEDDASLNEYAWHRESRQEQSQPIRTKFIIRENDDEDF